MLNIVSVLDVFGKQPSSWLYSDGSSCQFEAKMLNAERLAMLSGYCVGDCYNLLASMNISQDCTQLHPNNTSIGAWFYIPVTDFIS